MPFKQWEYCGTRKNVEELAEILNNYNDWDALLRKISVGSDSFPFVVDAKTNKIITCPYEIRLV